MNFDDAYIFLVDSVAKHGTRRPSRAGDVIGTFGAFVTLTDLQAHHFPIIQSRKVNYKPVMGELAAFLRGGTDLATFKELGCNYWDHNAKEWPRNKGKDLRDMQVGRIYGAQWRDWNTQNPAVSVDQIAELVLNLKADPYSRRHIVTAWRPDEDKSMCLPPCHIMFQCYVDKGELHMLVTMRSVDLCLGLPSDIVLYATLLLLLAKEANYRPGTLSFVLGDAHIYVNHLESWYKQREVDTSTLQPVSWKLNPQTTINNFVPTDIELVNYNPLSEVKYALN